MHTAGRYSLVTVLFLAGIASGCRSDAPDAPPPPAAEERVPRRAFRDVGCDITPATVLEGTGIGSIRVGMTLAELNEKCQVVGDSSVRVEGMTERIVNVDAGYDTVTAVIVGSRVWRIHVSGTEFTTQDALGVGTPASAIREKDGARLLAGEGVAFVTLDAHCGLSFRLAGVPADIAARGEWPVTDDLTDARVDEILIVGCAPDPPSETG
jgi:hypothetical protein